MAKKKESSKIKEVFDALETSTQGSEKLLTKYSKPLGLFFGIVILFIIGYIVYDNFIITPKNIEASDLMVDAQNLYLEGKPDQALGGKASGIPGFVNIADEYSSTKVGKLAAFYAGRIEFDKGNYQKALEYFRKFESPDQDMKAIKHGAIADTYVELNNNEEAMDNMTKATKLASSPVVIYQYTKKAALLAMSMNQNEKALELFQTIYQKYPDLEQSGEAEAYIERLKYTLGK